MPLVVLPAQPCDIAYPNKIYDVFFDAFTSPMHMLIPILFPQMDVKSEAFRKEHDTHAFEFASSPAARFQYPIKCIDTETGDVVGTAIFEVYWRPRTPAEWDPAKDKAEWLPAGSQERKRADDLIGELTRTRANIFGGRRYICAFPFALAASLHGPIASC